MFLALPSKSDISLTCIICFIKIHSYKDQYVETMAHLVDFAQNAYNDRENEIKLYKDLVDKALEDSVTRSKK